MVHKNCRTFFMCPPKLPKSVYNLHTIKSKAVKGDSSEECKENHLKAELKGWVLSLLLKAATVSWGSPADRSTDVGSGNKKMPHCGVLSLFLEWPEGVSQRTPESSNHGTVKVDLINEKAQDCLVSSSKGKKLKLHAETEGEPMEWFSNRCQVPLPSGTCHLHLGRTQSRASQ